MRIGTETLRRALDEARYEARVWAGKPAVLRERLVEWRERVRAWDKLAEPATYTQRLVEQGRLFATREVAVNVMALELVIRRPRWVRMAEEAQQ